MASRTANYRVSCLLVSLLVCTTGVADPVATVKDVMLGLTIPSSDFIWGVEEKPANKADWNAIRLNAVMLAESANLLLAPGRAHEGETWNNQARALADAATVAKAAAEARDFDGLIDSGETIYNSCESCHNVYLLQSAD